MRFTTIVATTFTLALSTLAQTTDSNNVGPNELLVELAQLPECATSCIATALPQSQCADPSDFACLCTDEAYITFSEQCILANCTIRGSLASQTWQKKACQAPIRDDGPLTRRIGDALLIIGAIAIAIRFVGRWQIQQSSIGWDDWTILISYLLLIPSTVIVQIMTRHGMGKDIWNVPFDDITLMLKYFYVEQYIYQVVIILTKISIVLLYLRIFPKSISNRFTYTCWAVVAGLTSYGLAFIVYFACECRPISHFWTQWDGEHLGTCLPLQKWIYLNSAFNILFDLIVFFLPVPKLMALQVKDKRRKVGAILTFLLGLFVTICSIVRLQYLAQLGEVANATYHYNAISLWSGLEGDVGVICACMPTIAGPVLYFFREKVATKISSFSKSNSTGKSSTMASTIASRITGNGDKSIKRLPSRASESESQLELDERDRHAPSGRTAGGIEKTTVTSVYGYTPPHLPGGDDADSVGPRPPTGKQKDPWEMC